MGRTFTQYPQQPRCDSTSAGASQSGQNAARRITALREDLNFVPITETSEECDSKHTPEFPYSSLSSLASPGPEESVQHPNLRPSSPTSGVSFSNVSYGFVPNFPRNEPTRNEPQEIKDLREEVERLRLVRRRLLDNNLAFARKFSTNSEHQRLPRPCTCLMIDGENVANAHCPRHIIFSRTVLRRHHAMDGL